MKRKLLIVGLFALPLIGNAQYCEGGGPSYTGDSNLEDAFLAGETSSISYTGCPGVAGVELRLEETADLVILSTYTADITWGRCGSWDYSKSGRAWIDFDGNGTFDGDEVIGSISYSSPTVSDSYDFTVPADAVVGTTRMRVMVQESGAATDPCASFNWGSVTDFSIEILPNCTDVEYTASATDICVGETVTLTGISPGTITWDGGVTDGVAFDPGPAGSYTYTPTSDDPDACPGEPVTINVLEYPEVGASVTDTDVCDGDAIVFTGTGAATYVWDMGVTDGVAYTPAGIGTETYTVTGTNEGGCSGTATVDVTVNPVPTVSGSVSDDEICEGETIIFTKTGDADSYEWDPADIVEGVPYMPADGVETFTVTGYFDATGCSTSDEITITLNPTPYVSASGGDGNFCDGTPIILAAGGDADITSWDPADFNPGPGSYTYTVSGHYEGFEECVATASVDIIVHDLPVVSGSSDYDEMCVGGAVVLTGSGAESYTWDMGATDGMPYSLETIGTSTFTVTGTDEYGCSNTATVDVEVVEGITIAGTTSLVTEGNDGAINIEPTGGVPAYTYDWNIDGTGDFDDSEDLTELAPGSYTVIVRDATVCQTSKTFVVGSQLSVEKLAMDDLSIYPNPTNNFINIQLEGQFDYTLYSINGKELLNGKGVDQEQLNLADFSDGIYFVSLNNETGSITVKVVKQ